MLPFRLATVARSVVRQKSWKDVRVIQEDAEHLCVFIHGLNGNYTDMEYASKALLETFQDSKIHLLNVKGNSGSLTWDGLEQGGERVCQEIESEIELVESAGQSQIKRLSVIGYSIGGLFARYAVGLLYSKGVLNGIEPVNFVTFATPHLGVRTPLKGITNHIWNVAGARTLSLSGRQLFAIDNFGQTGRPILEVIADPNSVLIQGLRAFRRKTLYANIINEDSTTFYTTGISKYDPFENLNELRPGYLPGYEPVIVDWANPTFSRASTKKVPISIVDTSYTIAKHLSATIIAPILVLLFIVGSTVMSMQSWRRIRLHKEGKS